MFLKKLKIELQYDPAILLLGIYPEKTILQKDTFSALLTIARTWKQPKYPPTEEWIKKNVVHIYDGIFLNHKKEQHCAICRNVDSRPTF